MDLLKFSVYCTSIDCFVALFNILQDGRRDRQLFINGKSNKIILFSQYFQGGLRHASASIGGSEAYKHMKFEGGVHRVQRVPKTEKQGRIHTSTMTVAILPQPTEVRQHSLLRGILGSAQCMPPE